MAGVSLKLSPRATSQLRANPPEAVVNDAINDRLDLAF